MNSTFTPVQLRKDARALCKGFGRFIGWEIEVCGAPGTARLVAKFVRHYNPNRPLASQAIERTTMVL